MCACVFVLWTIYALLAKLLTQDRKTVLTQQALYAQSVPSRLSI